jgi:hypothetical protein
MTTLSKLLAQKQELIEQLQEEIGPEERDEIERLLEKIEAALDLLDKAGPGGPPVTNICNTLGPPPAAAVADYRRFRLITYALPLIS